jgi:hypothetical protein
VALGNGPLVSRIDWRSSNAFVAEEQAPGDRGPNRVLRGIKIACTRIESRRTGLWQQTGVESPAYPSLYQESMQ